MNMSDLDPKTAVILSLTAFLMFCIDRGVLLILHFISESAELKEKVKTTVTMRMAILHVAIMTAILQLVFFGFVTLDHHMWILGFTTSIPFIELSVTILFGKGTVSIFIHSIAMFLFYNYMIHRYIYMFGEKPMIN